MRFQSSLALGAFAALASAQTFTDCDPTKKDCPNDPGMAATFETDFKAGASSVKGWKQTAGSLSYGSDGAKFTINKKGDAPTIQSETALFFGTVEVKAKAAPGQGIISSIVLESADLDEVDWEFIGGDNTNVQMNYFGKGNTTAYDRMIKGPVSNTQEIHTYTLDWTSDALTWAIDGASVRTLKYADAVGGKNFPQTPSTVRIGIWAGGDSDNEKGVIEWAGGLTDYSKGPYTMTVESVKITNKNPGKEYKWTDKTGSWQSIEVIDKGESAPQNSAVLAPSASVSGGGLQSQALHPTATGSGSGAVSTGAPYTNGTSNGNSTEPCECEGGVKTVTVIGYPPSSAPATLQSTTVAAVQSSSLPVPPVTTVPVVSSPPSIQTDTAPAPSIPAYPTAPSGGVYPTPSKNGTVSTSATPPQFTGAASQNKIGALAGLAAAAMLFV